MSQQIVSKYVSEAIVAGIDALVKKYDLDGEEVHRIFGNAFRDVLVAHGGKGPTYEEWVEQEERKHKVNAMNSKINK